MQTAIHKPTIKGVEVHMFKPPHGGMDFPWMALADVLAFTKTPPDIGETLARLAHKDFPAEIATIGTERGVERLVSLHIAKGIVDAAYKKKWITSQYVALFAVEWTQAMTTYCSTANQAMEAAGRHMANMILGES
jgi:hypothetical protein